MEKILTHFYLKQIYQYQYKRVGIENHVFRKSILISLLKLIKVKCTYIFYHTVFIKIIIKLATIEHVHEPLFSFDTKGLADSGEKGPEHAHPNSPFPTDGQIRHLENLTKSYVVPPPSLSA